MENIVTWYNKKIEEAQFYRLGVMAFILMVHANVIVPATLLAITTHGNDVLDLIICAGFSFLILVTLLSVMPPKITIPVFLTSTAAHIAVILCNVL